MTGEAGPAGVREPRDERAIILSDGRRIGIAEFGPPDGFPVFWFHGTPGARRQVPPMAIDYAEERGIRIVGVERPGVGWSTPHLYSRMCDWAQDVSQLADSLRAETFGLVGLSGGGPYVLACAAMLPDRVVAAAVLGGVAPTTGPDAADGGLVALARPFGPLLTAVREPVGAALSFSVRNVIGPFTDQLTELYLRFGPQSDTKVLARPEMRGMLTGDLRNAAAEQFKAILFDVVLFGRHWGFELGEIRVPVYFWHGDADFFVPLGHGEHMARLVPGGALHFRPGDGHLATLDAAVEALELIHGLRIEGSTGTEHPED